MVRTLFTIVIAVSLAVLPARLGAIGISAGAGILVSVMAECQSTAEMPCDTTAGMTAAVDDTVPMSGGCDRTGNHGSALPGACSTYATTYPPSQRSFLLTLLLWSLNLSRPLLARP